VSEDPTRAMPAPGIPAKEVPAYGRVGPADPHADPATHPGLRPADVDGPATDPGIPAVRVGPPEPPTVPTEEHASYDRPVPPAGVNPIGSLTKPGRATVEGRIRAVEIRPVERNSVLAVEIADSTGDLTVLFYGRSHIPGLICGGRVRFTGSARIRGGQPVMINPAYELVSAEEAN